MDRTIRVARIYLERYIFPSTTPPLIQEGIHSSLAKVLRTHHSLGEQPVGMENATEVTTVRVRDESSSLGTYNGTGRKVRNC